MCCSCGGGSTSEYADNSTLGQNWGLGVAIMGIEVLGWILFYAAYKDSIAYVQYLIDDAEGDLVFDNFSTEGDFEF